MTGRYKEYPKYKYSGEIWLNEVPEHWNVVKLSYFLKLQSGDSITSNHIENEGLYPVMGGNGHRGYTSTFNCNGKYALIGRQGALCGNINLACGKFYASEHAIVVYPNVDFNLTFLSGFLRFMNLGQYSVSAAQPGISVERINGLKIAFPSIDEQNVIGQFLDHETAKIDTLITKQEKLIELLKEKRQAVISHAVTKGLNPDASMKDSGVEWLGEVPEHWAVSKLKWKAQTTSGGTPSTSKYEVYYEGGDIPWIRTTDLNNGKLLATPVSITAKALEDTACSILPKYSVLLAMYGGAGSIGKHSLLMFEAAINQAVCGIYPSSSFEPEFLHYFYEFYRPFWMINAAGTRKDPNIGQDHIKEAKIALPPKEEQRAIVAYVNKTLDLLNKLNDKAIEAIELAKERKTALISAAVTGKIDVRDWQPKGVQG
ncbi:restriction endonuclease subunit S [Vibrio alginolyticus]|nr:restriction endonuclease subunit S [Vibrio alginolyticus]